MIRPVALLAVFLASVLASCFVSCLAGGALAETQWTPPAEIRKAAPAEGDAKPRVRPVAAFGEDHPDCAEWTDGCIVCKRQEAGDPACSMPGVACLPAEPDCLKSASAAPDAQPAAHK